MQQSKGPREPAPHQNRERRSLTKLGMKQSILTDVVFSVWIMRVHKLQQANFNLCLVQERLFVFNDFYGDVFFFLMIVCFANLKKNVELTESCFRCN